MTDFDYSGLDLDNNAPIHRTTCFALHWRAFDPMPSRCSQPYNHVGNHVTRDTWGKTVEEWENEDAL